MSRLNSKLIPRNRWTGRYTCWFSGRITENEKKKKSDMDMVIIDKLSKRFYLTAFQKLTCYLSAFEYR